MIATAKTISICNETENTSTLYLCSKRPELFDTSKMEPVFIICNWRAPNPNGMRSKTRIPNTIRFLFLVTKSTINAANPMIITDNPGDMRNKS